MTFIPNPDYKVFKYGDAVYLASNFATTEGLFTAGHKFRVIKIHEGIKSDSRNKADIKDDDGRVLYNMSYIWINHDNDIH